MKANVKWRQRVLRPSTPIRRKESLTSTSWFTFLHWMLGLGGLALLAWIWYSGYLLGFILALESTPTVSTTPTLVETPSLERAATALEAVAEKLNPPKPPVSSAAGEESEIQPPVPVRRQPRNFLEWDRQP